MNIELRVIRRNKSGVYDLGKDMYDLHDMHKKVGFIVVLHFLFEIYEI